MKIRPRLAKLVACAFFLGASALAQISNPPGGGGSGTVGNCATINALAKYTASTTTGCSNVSEATGTLQWPTGLGAITHVLGPSDQLLQITNQNSQPIKLFGQGTLSLGGNTLLFINLDTNAGTPRMWSATDNGTNLGVPGGAWKSADSYQYGVSLTATAALTAGQVVKIDAANPNAVVVTATTDTGGGIVVGIVANSPGAGAAAQVVTSGQILTPLLGTGTCATLGQFVIVDTTTGGRVQCTATYTAGTVIGKVIVVQSTVGSPVGVMVGLR